MIRLVTDADHAMDAADPTDPEHTADAVHTADTVHTADAEHGAQTVPAGTGAAPADVLGPVRALVITVSTRAASGVYEDRSGPLLASLLREVPGPVSVDGPRLVPDGAQLADVLAAAVAADYDVVLTTGGTGLSRDDRTPEATRRVLDLEIPGIPELLRSTGVAAGVPTAVFSRGVAGLAGRVFVVNLPGSTGAVRDAMSVLGPLLGEIVRHSRGGSH